MFGSNLKKKMVSQYFEGTYNWEYVEIVPENWNPNNKSDVLFLHKLRDQSQIFLHSLSMNIFGSGPEKWVIDRIDFWCKELDINFVSDHYSWTGFGDDNLGIFIPPITNNYKDLESFYLIARKKIGYSIGLENITTYFDDPGKIIDYHKSLANLSINLDIKIILDIENIVLDGKNSDVLIVEILNIYKAIEQQIIYYHIAGSENGNDTHSNTTSIKALEYLRMMMENGKAPVIYERDYNLDLLEIDTELKRIETFLKYGR